MASKKLKSDEEKPIFQAKRLKQSTLHNSSCSISSDLQPGASTVGDSPQSQEIHIYSSCEIEGSHGLEKDYKIFWNREALRVCSDRDAMKQLPSKQEIEGAINITWTLHKSELLQLQVEKINVLATQMFRDETERSHSLSNVKANWKRVKGITDEYVLLKQSSESEEVSEYMRRLKRAQAALKKAIDRKLSSFESCCAVSYVTEQPEQLLSQGEIDAMATSIITERLMSPLPSDQSHSEAPDLQN